MAPSDDAPSLHLDRVLPCSAAGEGILGCICPSILQSIPNISSKVGHHRSITFGTQISKELHRHPPHGGKGLFVNVMRPWRFALNRCGQLGYQRIQPGELLSAIGLTLHDRFDPFRSGMFCPAGSLQIRFAIKCSYDIRLCLPLGRYLAILRTPLCSSIALPTGSPECFNILGWCKLRFHTQLHSVATKAEPRAGLRILFTEWVFVFVILGLNIYNITILFYLFMSYHIRT